MKMYVRLKEKKRNPNIEVSKYFVVYACEVNQS